jgi:tripartite-type tricarboxylate transporter receptor subunit TctC
MNCSRRTFLAAAVAAGALPAAFAQTWPARPVRILVPFVPGGGADTIARSISSALQQRLGQPVVVENKPGAGGAVAADLVAKSPADGYTLMIGTNTFVTNPAITKTSYDPVRDFTAITTLGTSPYLLLVGAQSEFRTLDDLLKAGRAQPDKLSFGSAGNGGVTHLLGELLKQRGKVPAQHVPYKGTATALTDLIGGQVQFAFADTAAAVPQVKGGKLRALATTAPQRSALLPDVPTLTEAGVKLEVVGFYGLFAPARLPAPVLQRLHADVAAVLGTQEIRDRFAAGLTDAVAMPQEQFARMLATEVALWRDVVRSSGSKFD